MSAAESTAPSAGYRAARFAGFGAPEVLEVVFRDPPCLDVGEALVQVRAASINPSDVKNVAGRMRQTVPPRTPGRDFAGTVVAGPAEWLGVDVWGTGGDIGFTRDGSHAEMLALPVAALTRKPEALSFAEAGAVGVNYVTAWIGLMDDAGLRAGETVMVLGASGGVGGAACALARAKGARVIACVRGEVAETAVCRQVGAELLDLRGIDLAQSLREMTGGRGADVIYDCVGTPALFEPAIEALAQRGRMIVIAGTPGEAMRIELIPFYRKEARLIGVDSLKRGAAACAPMMAAMAEGFVTGAYPAPVIAQSLPLDHVREAYAAVAAGTRGRVVLTQPA
ncbi:NADPH:quinone reductase-like Zn-dependent oxidoreductase [Humitalea rosea]|uniref:NADPH:quinone reductase-like Zn-dependent oxidoreductase n=1 Tax=Humitalea rosea TaxID=990373 RepID=A0A2W7IZZ9_9PROT|nr:zinc-binding alcohol dehydrogenase family protein [Humitalea rosea]PZW44937.1 NADPH:quinone reductase-like Zn-dependent oxidoreductase [Humitalea rosea]